MEEARSVARNGSGRVMPEAMTASRFRGRARPPTARHMQCCLFAITLFALVEVPANGYQPPNPGNATLDQGAGYGIWRSTR